MSPRELNSDAFYRKWALIHSLLNLVGVLICVWQGNVLPLIVVNVCSFFFYLLRIRDYLIGFDLYIGYANWVTILRLLIILVSGFLLNILPNEVLFLFFALAIAMDGLDGYLAREFNHMSDFGARIDMETDAFLVLMLSLHHANNNVIPQWIILPGLMRFLFGIMTHFIATRDVTSKKFRATIAVIFFLSLLLAFILPKGLTAYLTNIAGSLILLSFGLSIYGMIKGIISRVQERKEF
ncbi:MAG: CDP-alcohol phosphatidyltransferase family protein [Bacteroidota bacterium]